MKVAPSFSTAMMRELLRLTDTGELRLVALIAAEDGDVLSDRLRDACTGAGVTQPVVAVFEPIERKS